MGSGGDESVGDQDSSTLVLGEETEPGGLSHQDLPGPLTEVGTLAANYTAGFCKGTDAAYWKNLRIYQ